MIELNVNKELPVITTNFEVVKASLIENIEKYKNVIVTEENLKDSKSDHKKIASMVKKIDEYRKNVKRELLVPVTKFEDNCKELTGLLLNVDIPLVAGIDVFNDKVRDTKKLEAEDMILKVIIEYGINEKYANQLNVLEKYCNLSAKAKDTLIDIEQRAFILLQEQEREFEQIKIEKERVAEALRLENERIAELKAFEEKRQIELAAVEVIRKAETMEIAVEHITECNKTIKNKIEIDDFKSQIELGATSINIIREINKRFERITEQEKPVIEPVIVPAEEIKEEPVELPFTDLELSQMLTEPVKMYFIEMRVEGTMKK